MCDYNHHPPNLALERPYVVNFDLPNGIGYQTLANFTSPESDSIVSINSSILGLKGGAMKKYEPLFAHLLRLFIDTDRLKTKKGKNRASIEENEQDHDDHKNLAESKISY